MKWVVVEDEHGRSPAVRMPGTSVILFPLTMISKRVEQGESVDVFELFNSLAANQLLGRRYRRLRDRDPCADPGEDGSSILCVSDGAHERRGFFMGLHAGLG